MKNLRNDAKISAIDYSFVSFAIVMEFFLWKIYMKIIKTFFSNTGPLSFWLEEP